MLSRLNAQYIYLDPPTASSICWELHQLLTKPIQHFLQQKEEKESVSSTEEIALRQRRTQYCREVLRRICYLFGEFCIVDSSDKLEPSGIHDDDAFETGTDQGTALPYRQLHLGVLHELIDQLVFLGNAIRFVFRRSCDFPVATLPLLLVWQVFQENHILSADKLPYHRRTFVIRIFVLHDSKMSATSIYC